MTSGSAWPPIPPGPILIVADNRAIARQAPDWNRRLAAAGRIHRVRVVGSGCGADLAAVAAEAASLGAVAILGAGDRPALDLAARVAAVLQLPWLTDEAENGADPTG